MKKVHALGWASTAIVAIACSSNSSQPPGTDAGGADSHVLVDAAGDVRTKHDAGGHEAGSSLLLPGQYCPGGTPTIRFDPPSVVVAYGHSRPVRAIVEPDICSPVGISFASSNAALVATPASATLDLDHPTYEFNVSAATVAEASDGSTTATLTATIPSTDAGPGGATAKLPITINNGALPTCAASDTASGMLTGSAPTLAGAGGLANASLAVPPGAFTRTDELAIQPFPGVVACASDDLTQMTATHPAAPGGLIAIGPAVTFTAGSPIDMTHSLRRELTFSIPVNPAVIPTDARLRHLQVLFMSPAAKGVASTPRTITIASPSITQTASGQFVLEFASPWFGTYQGAFAPTAGTVSRTRHLAHRAVIGVSMGSGGAAAFGFRHHTQFDVIAPMGGPSDWSWLFWYIETFNLGGFCPAVNTDGTPNPNYPDSCPTYAPNLYPFHETYAHTADYNHWFYQDGGGNGGSFNRADNIQIFTDFALMEGNPNGQNFDPTAMNADPTFSFLPAGPKGTDPWVVGNHAGLPGTCAVVVNPLSPDPNAANDPSYQVQQTWQSQCTSSRCDAANVWTAPASATTGYFDAKYNPTGQYPVITFCDGSQNGTSPYDDTWIPAAPGSEVPMNVALTVDLNGNGIRDINEPVLSQGHEIWSDYGVDGVADADEPGYDPVQNPDPNQDDYDFQLNPNGTEGDHRYEMGEPFLDYGLDGVNHTPQLKNGGFDFGEGDGVFTMATGLANFYATDSHSIIRQWSTAIPSGALTDADFQRIDIWSDGGVRDMFNFAAVANHLVGSMASRKAADGTQLKSTAFYNGFDTLPGQVRGSPTVTINTMLWADIVDAPSVRYGTIDATPAMIADGDGQHVGTAEQLIDRLQTSIYFAEQRWTDADRSLTNTDTTGDAGLGTGCSAGLCSFNFSGTNRTGPVLVQVPPGYDLPDNISRNVRYPAIYVLHGYGQTPSGLTAAALISTDLMNDPARSSATRLPKAILVYVDGRCRFSSDSPPQPECIEGSFYLNSPRPDVAHPGTNVAQFDTWFDELIDYIDQQFRTMGPSDVTVTE